VGVLDIPYRYPCKIKIHVPKCLTSEQDVQTLAVFNVLLTTHEDPIIRTQNGAHSINNGRFRVYGRIEDLAAKLA
jgi:hypothetical protein